MKQIIDMLRKLGLVQVSKGDGVTGEFDDRKDLKEKDSDAQEQGEGQEDNTTSKNMTPKKSGQGVVFWIVVVIAVFFFFALWGSGITVWSLLGIGMWGYLLYWIRKGAGATATVGKIVGLTLAAVIVSFILADTYAPEAGIVTTPEEEALEIIQGDAAQAPADESWDVTMVKTYLEVIGNTFDQKVTPVAASHATWTAERVSLLLTDAYAITLQKMSQGDLEDLQKFFLDDGATTGGLGFEFVPPVGTTSAGFVLNNNKFKQLMCVLNALDKGVIEIQCGYGPGGKAHMPQDRL